MAIFITGATGFIGKILVRELLSRGETVHILARNPAKATELKHDNLKVFKGDVLEPESLTEPLKGVDRVYHVASYVDIWSRDPATPFIINVQGTVNVLEACVKANVKRVVMTSTAGVFGPSMGKEIHEDSIRLSDFFVSYETSKYMAEEKAQQYATKGLEIMMVNPTRVYGPGELSKGNSLVKLISMYLKKGFTFLPGKGNKSGNYVFVNDVVTGHILAMEKGEKGEKYILGSENATFNQFMQVVREESGKKGWIIRIPLFVMFAFAKTQDWKAKIFKRPPLITTPFTRRYLADWSNSTAKAREKLGYKPLTLREGIKKTVEWLRELEKPGK